MARKLKIMENEKHPLDDLKNDEITKKRPRVPKAAESYIPYIFSEDEIERIFAAADTLPLPKAPNANVLFQVKFPMILRMLYGCGFRIGEKGRSGRNPHAAHGAASHGRRLFPASAVQQAAPSGKLPV